MTELVRRLFGGGKGGSSAGAKPSVILFCCGWSTLPGGQVAEMSSMNGKVQVVPTVCSGKVDPSFILKAFDSGVDGVMLAVCGAGECHYLSGNYQALRRVQLLQKTLGQLGIDPRRLSLHWTSPGDGTGLQDAVKQFVDRMAALGPVK